jgi:hypothetical protein
MLNVCGIVAAFLKMATGRNFSMSGSNSWNFWKRRIAPLMVTYHYVKFYVFIIIHLEVININVRNYNFPIGFYSNSHPYWTPQNMTLTTLPQSWKL